MLGRVGWLAIITKHFSCTEKNGGILTNNQAVLGYGLCKGIPTATPKTAEHNVPETSILRTEKILCWFKVNSLNKIKQGSSFAKWDRKNNYK